jgi:hypothetical protein
VKTGSVDRLDHGEAFEHAWSDPAHTRFELPPVDVNRMLADLPGPDGGVLRADRGQPLFHVEHSVGGEEGRPLNRWRIVHLTDGPGPRLPERFARMAEDPWLPEFVEIHLRDDLGVGLERRDVG